MEGTGLGLTISRRFVELLGGSIHVESEVNKGTVFKFDISIKPAQTMNTVTTSPLRRVVALEPGHPRYRILVVDDNPTNRLLLVRMLSAFGWDIREAENGKTAVTLYKTAPAHLIFMDIQMPVMDGFEATREIKSLDRKGLTTIIAVSASSSKDEQEAALAAGCTDFITKPFREADIYEAMEKHLGVRWVYETDLSIDKASTKDMSDTPLNLVPNLPGELRENLEDAITRADMAAIDRLIVQVGDHDPRLAMQLQELAHDFEYAAILALIKNPHRK